VYWHHPELRSVGVFPSQVKLLLRHWSYRYRPHRIPEESLTVSVTLDVAEFSE